MVWRFARRYPGHIAGAAIALLFAAAATSGDSLCLQADHRPGLLSGGGDIARWFQYSAVPGAGAWRWPPRSASISSSWLGERVVADIRLAVHRNLLRLAPRLLRGEPAGGDHLAASPSTRRSSSRWSARPFRSRCATSCMGIGCAVYPVRAGAQAGGMMLLGIPLIVVPLIFLGRRVRAISERQPGPHRRRRHDHRRDARRDEDRPGLRPAGAARRGRFADAVEARVRHRQAAHRAARGDDLPSSSR